MAGALMAGVECPDLFWGQAGPAGFVSDVVVGAAADECNVAGRELERGLRIVEPQPRPSLDNGMQRQRDGAGQPQAPRGLGHRPGEDAAGGAGPGQVILQNVHNMSVSRNESSVKNIDSLGSRSQD